MIRLAIPVILTYLGIMSMGLVDLLAVGRVSAVAMGNVGVGNAFFTAFMVFGLGMLAGLDFLVSHAHGANDPHRAYRTLIQGVWMALRVSVPLILILFWMSTNLTFFEINTEIAPGASVFLRIVACSLPMILMFNAFRQYFQALGNVKPALFILLTANVVNALANYGLVFGHWGFPAMGSTGSAISTLLSRTWMLIAMVVYAWNWDSRRDKMRRRHSHKWERSILRELSRLGLPAGLQMLFEVGVFAVATTLAARLAAVELAAHQIVLNLASMTFMVPMGICSATAVLVGRAVGRGDMKDAVASGWKGFGLGTGCMTIFAIVMLAFPRWLIGLYTNQEAVIATGRNILFLAALFQIADGLQVVATGALRGLGNTKIAMFANLFGHWAVGLPLGTFLCFWMDWRLQGLWTGLSIGLFSVATILMVAWIRMTRSIH